MIKALTMTGLLLLGYDAADLIITGIAVLAVAILLIAFWLAGGFTPAFWIDPNSEALSEVDVELDRLYPPVPARHVTRDYVDVTHYPEAEL